MQKAQQFWHIMQQTSVKSPAPSNSIEAPPSTDILVLHQHLQKLVTAFTVRLRTGKNGFNAFFYQARVPSVLSQLYSSGFGHQVAKHIIFHFRNISAAKHALRDNQGRLLDFKQLVTTLTGLKVTRWVIERGMLGQYQRARGILYPPGPFSPAND
jgi:hypothetical protein